MLTRGAYMVRNGLEADRVMLLLMPMIRNNARYSARRLQFCRTGPGPDFAYCSLAEQPIELPLGNVVTLARTLHQATAIDDRDVAAFVAD